MYSGDGQGPHDVQGPARRIVRNSLWILVGRAVEAGSMLLVVACTARYLGVEGFGNYAFLMSILWILSPLIILAIPRILARELARNFSVASEMIGCGVLLVLASVPVILLVANSALFLFRSDHTLYLPMGIGGAALLVSGLNAVVLSLCIAAEHFVYETISTSITAVAQLVGIYAVYVFDLGFDAVFLSLLMAHGAGLCSSCFFVRSRLGFRGTITVSRQSLAYVFKEAATVSLGQGLYQAYLYLGVFFLKWLSGPYAVGIYQAPMRLLNRLHVIPMSLAVAVFPQLSRCGVQGSEKQSSGVLPLLTLCKMLVLVAMPVLLVTIMFSEEIVRFVFGGEFAGAAVVLSMLIVGIGATFPALILETFLVAHGDQGKVVKVTAILLLTSLPLYYVCVHRYNVHGATAVTVAMNLLTLVLYAYAVRGAVPLRQLFGDMAKPVAAILAAVLAVLVMNMFGRLSAAALAMAVYAGVVYWLRFFTSEELVLLRRVILRR